MMLVQSFNADNYLVKELTSQLEQISKVEHYLCDFTSENVSNLKILFIKSGYDYGRGIISVTFPQRQKDDPTRTVLFQQVMKRRGWRVVFFLS